MRKHNLIGVQLNAFKQKNIKQKVLATGKKKGLSSQVFVFPNYIHKENM